MLRVYIGSLIELLKWSTAMQKAGPNVHFECLHGEHSKTSVQVPYRNRIKGTDMLRVKFGVKKVGKT